MFTVTRVCGHCGGDGQFPNADNDPITGELIEPEVTEDCVKCEGSGKLFVLTVENPTNIFDSYVVLEELDATEHAALSSGEKDGVLHLLACGRVDLNDGKMGKTRLWNWFGAESTTVANLTALLT
jgi:hypothetical protein